ncbi:MAG: superoxide dismutase [Rikenellaceae bacterium]
MKHQLQPLNYPLDALAPYISAETMQYHWGKHLQGYIDNLNQLIKGTPLEKETLETVITQAKGAIFNNAAQVYNHNFFFDTLSATAQLLPSAQLLEAINRDFGSLDNLKAEFEEKAAKQFGAGWCWLASDPEGVLDIVSYPNADNPLPHKLHPLMTIDVWEHAYYIDYRNRRADFIKTHWNVMDWKMVENRYKEVLNKD